MSKREECEILWTDIKETIEDLGAYLAAAGEEWNLEDVYEMAKRIVILKKRAETLKCPVKK